MKKVEFIEKYGEEAYQRHLEKQKQYYQQHKEQELKLQKQYNKQHRETIKEYQREYQKQHNQEHRERSRNWNRKKRSMFSYCIPEEIEQIENYELAKADNFNGWHLHHRLECIETGAVVNSSAQDLKDWGIYYNRPANELIFLTGSEHCSLHKRKKNREGL